MPFFTCPWKRSVRDDRLADDPVAPCDQPPFGIEPRLEAMDVHRPVATAAHVVFARPLHLHRRAPADRLRDRDSLDDHVGVGDRASAEAAARLHHVQPNLVGRGLCHLSGSRLIEVGHLVPAPDLDDPILGSARDGVHRLERRMGEVRKLERRLQHLGRFRERAFNVALVPRDRAGPRRKLAVGRGELGGRALLGFRRRPTRP